MPSFQRRMPVGFGARLTPLGKRLIIIYSTIYLLELIGQHWIGWPVYETLALFPIQSSGFRVWQLVTHAFVHNPGAPLNFALHMLMLFFFTSTIQALFGRQRFLVFFYLAALGAALGGLLGGFVPAFRMPFSGVLPSILAMVVVFGLAYAEATILLFFILPVKAKYIAYGTVIITGLTFLAKANPAGAFHLGGILAGFLYFQSGFEWSLLSRLRQTWHQWRRTKSRRHLRVIKDPKKDSHNKNGPTIH